MMVWVPAFYGSSPLARGTPDRVGRGIRRPRFIPAGAGNTKARAAVSTTMPVHPRWRGEHDSGARQLGFLLGSSPLARGTLPGPPPHQKHARFIPAGAGNTCRMIRRSIREAVHPRWRGEHQARSSPVPAPRGSSPLARGTRPGATVWHVTPRFIPAGAGNTMDLSDRRADTPVHPRWRGEHDDVGSSLYGPDGSSPLARGTLPAAVKSDFVSRFIPAGAGNTF